MGAEGEGETGRVGQRGEEVGQRGEEMGRDMGEGGTCCLAHPGRVTCCFSKWVELLEGIPPRVFVVVFGVFCEIWGVQKGNKDREEKEWLSER